MNYWLLKSEPSTYSIDDLKRQSRKTDHWDGIRNYTVRNMIRDDIQKGDLAFFYHSSCKTPGIVGVVKIVKSSYPDYTSWDPASKYYDPKSSSDNPRWLMFDVKLEKKFDDIISLAELRQEPALEDMLLLRKGNRLSITPVTKNNWEYIINYMSRDSK